MLLALLLLCAVLLRRLSLDADEPALRQAARLLWHVGRHARPAAHCRRALRRGRLPMCVLRAALPETSSRGRADARAVLLAGCLCTGVVRVFAPADIDAEEGGLVVDTYDARTLFSRLKFAWTQASAKLLLVHTNEAASRSQTLISSHRRAPRRSVWRGMEAAATAATTTRPDCARNRSSCPCLDWL